MYMYIKPYIAFTTHAHYLLKEKCSLENCIYSLICIFPIFVNHRMLFYLGFHVKGAREKDLSAGG